MEIYICNIDTDKNWQAAQYSENVNVFRPKFSVDILLFCHTVRESISSNGNDGREKSWQTSLVICEKSRSHSQFPVDVAAQT